jgi:hypothetical protein
MRLGFHVGGLATVAHGGVLLENLPTVARRSYRQGGSMKRLRALVLLAAVWGLMPATLAAFVISHIKEKAAC